MATTARGLAAVSFIGAHAAAQSGAEPTSWTGVQAVTALRARRITSEALVKAALARAERFRELNLFTSIDPDKALNAAREIDRRRAAGEDVGPLAGLPLIIKDNIDSASLPTTAGSSAFAGWQPARDAPVLAALLGAGGVMLGKANMHEMAFGVTSNNPVYGPVRNPYNTNMIPGGSSGGTAAAIGARVVTGGLGSDTGGSCRVPAALCGCVGFRPTIGRYSSAGVIPLTWTQDTPGPLGRTVEDVMLLDSICAKRPVNVPAITLAGARIAMPASLYQDLDPELARVVTATLDVLRQAGVVLVDADVTSVSRSAVDQVEGPRAIATYLLEHGSRMSVLEVFEKVKGPIERRRLQSQLPKAPTDPGAYVESLVVRRAAYLATVANYQVLELIGAGAMGEVYRAHETRLGRDIVLKVLPRTVANDPERLARLEREAHLLASLNHAHVATLHSLEEADGVRALVMEFACATRVSGAGCACGAGLPAMALELVVG